MTQLRRPTRIAVIGYGAITDEIVTCLERRGQIGALIGVLDLPERIDQLKAKANGRFPVVAVLNDLMATKPDLVIEAAGHAAAKRFAPQVLSTGADLLIASVGALADRDFASRLEAASAEGGDLWIAAGAVAGIDGLLAARTAGLKSVTYTSLKGPKAWTGTPGEKLLGPTADRERVIFFKGSARDAAIQYPQNANVGATIALASLGLDRTAVHLGSDPKVAGPLGIIDADGEFGTLHFEILALASPINPKTSAITGHSLIAAALDGMRFRPFALAG
ncbi:MAG TPA: aspartate dehydrogenase [Alphaproteobacteria bacterium]